MVEHRKPRVRDTAVAATVAVVSGAFGVHKVINEFDSPSRLLSHCTVAELGAMPDDQQVAKARSLLAEGSSQPKNVAFLGAACFTRMGKRLNQGVDIGQFAFGPGEPYTYFDDCTAFLSDEAIVPTDGLRLTQVVIACRGIHYALNA